MMKDLEVVELEPNTTVGDLTELKGKLDGAAHGWAEIYAHKASQDSGLLTDSEECGSRE